MRRSRFFGVMLVVLAMGLAACADDTASTTTTSPDGEEVTTTVADSPTTTAPDTPPDVTTVRVALPTPAVGIDPVLINDEGGLAVFGQAAEYLIFSDDELNPVPVLAESWESNDTGDVWTFHLNPAATFHDGSPITADDVVATVQGIAGGNAGPAFQTYGVDPAQVVAVDAQTVEFTLTQPSGAFPFFMSSDNYNAAILPASFWAEYEEGAYEQSFIGSGPWIVESFDPGVSAVYVKNEDYWGDNSDQPDRMEVTFFADESAAVTGILEGRFDVIPHISYSGATSLIDNPDVEVSSISTAQHRQVYFDTSKPPFDDNRVRQAIALALDRDLLVDGLLGGFGVVGNDHPIWVNFPMYDPGAVEQRTQNLEQAQQLLADAGYPDGFEAPLDTLVFFEVEDLAVLIQQSVAPLGIDLNVGVYDSGTYYTDYWLAADASMGIVNYGHRGVPNVYLGAPLLSPERLGDDSWNASHWSNAEYDALFDQFTSAPDLETQTEIAGQMQALLNDEVPFIVPYYVDHISVTRPGFSGLEVTGMGHYSVVDGSFSD
ncbi:MAG TPA: ABC transporter substrate-binding protein [Acidimicrobiia bacterium]|nr:ABC transporter substrate-binding protein [Acidimicrobiia bacterium]